MARTTLHKVTPATHQKPQLSKHLSILKTVDARAENEFAESMRIVRGLPPDKGGAQ